MKTIFLSILFSALFFSARNGSAQPASLVSVPPAGKTTRPFTTEEGAEADLLAMANRYIRQHLDAWGLSPEDISDMTVNDLITDPVSGITRIYFLQRYRGIPVHQAILLVCMTKEGLVFNTNNRFTADLASKINTLQPEIAPETAVRAFAFSLGIEADSPRLKGREGLSSYRFDGGVIAREDITAELYFQPVEGQARLCWDLHFAPIGSHDRWNARVDAITGEIVEKDNWTLYCLPAELPLTGSTAIDAEKPNLSPVPALPARSGTTDGAQYNVWPAPLADAADGPRSMVANPADSVASPYGWHDMNGQPGPEFTITRGNNVFAYQDRFNLGYSSGDEPDGGPTLQFDFPYDPAWEPEQYREASVVNLFYWINYMHDFMYPYGFNEASGNFQFNNYGHGGEDHDFIWGVAQAGALDGLHNNAEYSHQLEGISPSIFMFIFDSIPAYLTVDAPASIAGVYRTNVAGTGWGTGAYLTDQSVTGEVVLVNDGVETPSTADGCQDIINAPDLNGKIAMIERGGCQFGTKALKAQQAGAIGVIFYNFENSLNPIGAGPDGAIVHIPVVMLNIRDVRLIQPFAGHGLKVTLQRPAPYHPKILDSDLENVMIAHEFGHGVSIRLVGGPHISCMHNAEEMGEGWSDFLALAVTAKPGDTGTTARTFGQYATREQEGQNGYRRHAYSTDMAVNPLTYGDVALGQEIHELGEVWASMLWDMYWALVDRYGWNADYRDPESGNYKAVRLVVEGLKNTVCSPGFVDGRNAILVADSVLYQGANAKLLWQVFARRGLGYSADQGSSEDAGDQQEAFDMPPALEDKIQFSKQVTDFIQPGEDIQVSLQVNNFKTQTITNVVVLDEIPDGTSYVAGSANYAPIIQGNQVWFDLGNMNPGKEKTITYTLRTSAQAWSEQTYLDMIPDTAGTGWIRYTIGAAAANPWMVSDSLPAHSGLYAWSVREIPERSRQALMIDPADHTCHVEGDFPALRFYHRYNTKAGVNGGVVEIREAGETTWHPTEDRMLRNGYDGKLDFSTFMVPSVEAFSGNHDDDYRATYIDLRPWQNKDIEIRFRFGTATNTHEGSGWLIDDIEFLDLLHYNTEACVQTDQNDLVCAFAPQSGTIVDSRPFATGIMDPAGQQGEIVLFPNPANDQLSIVLPVREMQEVLITMFSADGQIVFRHRDWFSENQLFRIDTKEIAPGMYFIAVQSSGGLYTGKVVLQSH